MDFFDDIFSWYLVMVITSATSNHSGLIMYRFEIYKKMKLNFGTDCLLDQYEISFLSWSFESFMYFLNFFNVGFSCHFFVFLISIRRIF